ncbi:hypothetical protein BU15DRAFT_77902 [Melanogaster broomeanus]|nr:hypothetical protein BU15DRAFT_77902 [Melanogaster broomeanus]
MLFQIFNISSIRPSYKTGTRMELLSRAIKRKDHMRRKHLQAQDSKLKSLNARLQTAKGTLYNAGLRVARIEGRAAPSATQADQLSQAVRAMERAEATYTKALHHSAAAIGTSTGRVGLLLPSGLVASRRI